MWFIKIYPSLTELCETDAGLLICTAHMPNSDRLKASAQSQFSDADRSLISKLLTPSFFSSSLPFLNYSIPKPLDRLKQGKFYIGKFRELEVWVEKLNQNL